MARGRARARGNTHPNLGLTPNAKPDPNQVLAPQLKAQEASCGSWLPDTALELGALAEVRRRVALLTESVRRQPFALVAAA